MRGDILINDLLLLQENLTLEEAIANALWNEIAASAEGYLLDGGNGRIEWEIERKPTAFIGNPRGNFSLDNHISEYDNVNVQVGDFSYDIDLVQILNRDPYFNVIMEIQVNNSTDYHISNKTDYNYRYDLIGPPSRNRTDGIIDNTTIGFLYYSSRNHKKQGIVHRHLEMQMMRSAIDRSNVSSQMKQQIWNRIIWTKYGGIRS